MRQIWEPSLADRTLNILIQGVRRPKISLEDADTFCGIIQILRNVKPEKGLDALIETAKSNSVRLRRVAIQAIEHYPESQRLDALAQLFDTDDKSVLKKVAMALGKAKDPRAVVPLIRTVEECVGTVRKKAYDLLKKQTNLHDISFLIEALRMKWPSVKKFAAKEIEKLDSPEFIDPLLIVMEDKDVDVQMAVTRALKKFADNEHVANRLVKTISYGDLSLRQLDIEVIGEAGMEGKTIENAIDPLIRALGNRFLRDKAKQALKRIRDRRGLRAIKRREIREAMIPKPPRPMDIELMKMAEEKDSSRLMNRLQ